MLDDQFNIRIADFGFAASLKGLNGDGFLKSPKGSKGYRAPEIEAEKAYRGNDVDVFALGVILFNLLSGSRPFELAIQFDTCYQKIAVNRYDIFWEYFERKRIYPEDFKDLINNMLQLEPKSRLSIAEIVAHPWM
ncbi:MAG: protein kinase domain-containing protein [Flammeovirgaceae bacterium]